MFTKNLLCVVAAVVIVSLSGVTSANAAPVNLVANNASFELPAIPSGQDYIWDAVPTGWTKSTGGWPLPLNNSAGRFTSIAPDGGTQVIGVLGDGANSTVTLTQQLTQLLPNTTYTLSGYAGWDTTNTGNSNLGGSIAVTGGSLGSGSWATLTWAASEPTGVFSQKSAQFTTDGAGGNYNVVLTCNLAPVAGHGTGCSYFDAISVTVVPEPGTLALLSAGLLGLLCYAWRKRK